MRGFAQSVGMTTAILVVCLSNSSVQAASDSSTCASIRDDAARLECYDLVFKKSYSRSTETAKWDVVTEISKIDDTKNVHMVVDSREPFIGRFGQEMRGTLYIMCRENETNLSIWFGGYYMSDHRGGGEITYRIDVLPAAKARFLESNNNEHLGLWSGATAVPFIKKMFSHDNILIRATPFSDSSVTMEFPITGIEDAIAPLRDACHW